MHVKDIWMENLNVKVPKNISVIIGDEKPSGGFKQDSKRDVHSSWQIAGT